MSNQTTDLPHLLSMLSGDAVAAYVTNDAHGGDTTIRFRLRLADDSEVEWQSNDPMVLTALASLVAEAANWLLRDENSRRISEMSR